MTSSLETRLRALAEQELDELSRERAVPREPIQKLQRLESQVRSSFLLDDRGITEVQQLLREDLLAWRAFIRSDAPQALWSDANRPQFSEYLMTVCELLLGGLQASIAACDDPSVAEFRSVFLKREAPEFEIAAATLLMSRQLCAFHGGEFERAAREIRQSWAEWTETGMVHSPDAMWSGLRGVANGDTELVQASLREMSRRRAGALQHAAASGLMLRSTTPVRLVLQTDSAALVRLARKSGMDLQLRSNDLLTLRAVALWRLDDI